MLPGFGVRCLRFRGPVSSAIRAASVIEIETGERGLFKFFISDDLDFSSESPVALL